MNCHLYTGLPVTQPAKLQQLLQLPVACFGLKANNLMIVFDLLQVVGVSFHVGSGCQNVGVYAEAISRARAAFDTAAELGFDMTLLDIGGGFTAPYDAVTACLFYATAAVINEAIDTHFPANCGVRIIAEPGRYFAETSATLFTSILGQRASMQRCLEGGLKPFRDYWLSDGTYGSFRILVSLMAGITVGACVLCRAWVCYDSFPVPASTAAQFP